VTDELKKGDVWSCHYTLQEIMGGRRFNGIWKCRFVHERPNWRAVYHFATRDVVAAQAWVDAHMRATAMGLGTEALT
jgi:hypothetical protein